MALLRQLTGEQKRTLAHWAMELVVVVVGVLIALWLQEWVERQRAIKDMEAAEEAIHQEVRSSLSSLISREALSKCHLERAQRLKEMLASGDANWPGINDSLLARTALTNAVDEPVVPSVYARSWSPFTRSAWDSALASGALAAMDRDRFARLVELYDRIDLLKRNQEREDRGATTLSALAFPQELSPETRTRMLGALYEVDASRFYFNASGVSELADGMAGVGWNDRVEIGRFIAEQEAEARARDLTWPRCYERLRNPFDHGR